MAKNEARNKNCRWFGIASGSGPTWPGLASREPGNLRAGQAGNYQSVVRRLKWAAGSDNDATIT